MLASAERSHIELFINRRTREAGLGDEGRGTWVRLLSALQHVELFERGVCPFPIRVGFARPAELGLMARLAGFLWQRWDS